MFFTFPACVDFCRLLINFANSLDPDQAHVLSAMIWIQCVGTQTVIIKEIFCYKSCF